MISTTTETFTITIVPEGTTPTPTPGGGEGQQPGEIDGGDGFYYKEAQTGLLVGDDIDLSQTYYVKVDGQWKEVSISKDTYYSEKTGDTYNHYVQKTEKSDGFYGDADPITGWTPITGDGMYYMKDHNTFLQVQSVTGNLTHYAYSNKLIASKSGNQADGLVTGPSESIGGWDTGTTTAIVVERDGTQHQVLYANKGSTFHYNMFVYYMDGNQAVYLTQGANESDGDSKYYNTYPTDRKSDTPAQGVGKYYYTYNNTLGSYGGKGYYTGTYYKPGDHDGKIALYFVDGGETKWLSTSGVTENQNGRTTAIHDQQVVYTGPLYQLQTLQRATYFSYEGGTPVESRLAGDELTNLKLYTRRMASDTTVITDTDPDNAADKMGTLVDTTNNFKGNLFIQKKLYRKDDGTYNIKLESWATGNMSTTGGEPMDVVLVVDLSHSMDLAGSDFTINGQSRIYYVRQAIQDFINTMYTANQNGADIRLAITSFANLRNEEGSWGSNGDNVYPTGIYNGSTFTRMKSATSTQYQNALMKVDDNGKTTLLKTLQHNNFQDPQGNSTHPEEGMDLAINILKNRTDATKNRQPVVVFFTDGWPGYDSQDASKYAETALERANTLKAPKAQNGYDATIYSIGVFHFNDADTSHMHYALSGDTATFTVQSYMQHMSSMYNQTTLAELPGRTDHAKAPTNNTPDNTDQTYYYRIRTGTSAGNPLQELNDAFNNIATTIADTDVPVDTTSILRDVINENDFALPRYVASGENATVKVSEVPAAAINSRKQIQWNYDGEIAATGVKASPIQDGAYLKGVNVSGYNYQSHFSAPNLEDLSKSDLGDKLVVRIYGLMPKHGGEVYSNSEAGILNAVKNADGQPTGQFEMYLGVESPFDTIAKRSYVVDFNASMKVAENGKLATTDDAKVSDITARPEVSGDNGTFTKSGSTILYQLKEKKIDNQFRDYSYTGSDTALAFGQYYKNDTRAVTGKTADAKVTLYKQVFDPDTGKESKVPDPVDKAWQVVNMIPASSIYYDDDLKTTTATIGDGSGYNVAVEVSPETKNADPGRSSFAFTGTGIDIYCTTDTTGGYAQAKVDGEQVQTMKNYSITTRYNVPTFSFRGLEYGKHLVELNILSKSNYRLDGVRIYGPEEDQTIYAEPTPTPAEGETATNTSEVSATQTEQYGVYLNLRDALMNDKNKDKKDNFTITNDAAIQGALFVDDSSKLVQLVTATEEQIEKGEGIVWQDAQGNTVAEGTPGAIAKINYYQSEFAAYTENSPKHEIYLQGTKPATDTEEAKPGQALIFELSPLAAQAAKSGNLWIGLSAPDAALGTDGKPTLETVDGKVTINGTETAVTSGVDMYYPITKAMLGDDGKTVTLTNTGTAMISVTNLKITGIKSIYDAANAAPTPEANTDPTAATASVLSVEDAMSMVFEPVTMRSIKLAAHNGVDPDLAVVEPEPTQEPEPSPTAEPEVTPDPTPAPTAAPTPVPTQAPNVHTIVKQLISNFVSSLFRSIARLFG